MIQKNLRQPRMVHKKAKRHIKRYVIAFLVVFSCVLAGGIYLDYLKQGLPSIQNLQTYEPYLTTQIISADSVVIKEITVEKRILVPLNRIPQNLIYAVLATEDTRFYHHWGVDTYRFCGALFKVLTSFSYREGFSTITMQFARDYNLTRSFQSSKRAKEKTITRKLREIITAIRIERRYSKNEILEMYLNNVYFGHGANGAQTAARMYFNKEVDNLTLEECALLTSQLPNPAYYSPINHPNRALARRNLILNLMFKRGFITIDELNTAINKPITVKNQASSNAAYGTAPYFTEYVRLKLEDLQDQYGFNIERDGLKVYTTLDTRAQAIAEKSAAEQLENQQKTANSFYKSTKQRQELLYTLYDTKQLRTNPDKIPQLAQNTAFMDSLLRELCIVQVAFAAMDINNGYILALIGGRDFNESQFNRATQATRQPGSAFKPFVYTVAINKGNPVTTQLLNQPIPIQLEDGTEYIPENYEKTRGGYTTLREGLMKSINIIAIRIIKQLSVSPKEVVELAHKMGITSQIDAVDAIPLGTSSVIPLELISAYSTFPNKGIKVSPVFITKIEDRNGDILYNNHGPVREEVLDEATDYIMTDLLKDVVRKGTGQNAHNIWGFARPAGGKTGTTDNCTDAWFIGFTPQIVAGVWVGIDNYAFKLGNNQTGAVVALPIWSKFMKQYHDELNLPVLDFKMPPGVVELDICADTKELATKYCPVIMKEIFLERSLPTKVCEKHTIPHSEIKQY